MAATGLDTRQTFQSNSLNPEAEADFSRPGGSPERLLDKIILTRESLPTLEMAQDIADLGLAYPRKTERPPSDVCRPRNRGRHRACFRQVPWRREGAFLR